MMLMSRVNTREKQMGDQIEQRERERERKRMNGRQRERRKRKVIEFGIKK